MLKSNQRWSMTQSLIISRWHLITRQPILITMLTLNSNKETEKENTSPTLQVNPINTNNRPLCSGSSGSLAQKVSFKSFKNTQQSCERSCMNSHEDEIPGTLDQN